MLLELFGKHKCSQCGSWCVWIDSVTGNGNFGWFCRKCAEHRELLDKINKLDKKLRLNRR
jgi:hypothetical protein